MYDIGLSTCGKEISEKLFQEFNKSGISAMEISVSSEDYCKINYNEIAKWSQKYNVDLWSFHFPFSPFEEIDISNPDICKSTIKYFKELIKKASDAGIQKFIIHPSGEPISDDDRPIRMKCAKEGLAELAEYAKENNSVIAVEDLPRSCLGKDSDEIAELISVHENLRVCFDTNHLLNEDPADFVRKIGNKIITTHISDYDFVNERHWLPGEGKLNWNELLNAFADINYNGVWLYEIRFDCPVTIIRNRDLNCDDFVRNAKELFNKKDITVISTPKENLGFWE